MCKIVAMVPIKLNNERLPGKNTKALAGRPLIDYILSTLKEVQSIDEIYVFCSDDAIVSYLPDGVKFLKRSPELDLPTANFTQFFDAFQKEIDADIYVFTHATAPFVKKETFDLCIEKVKSNMYDSAFSATRIQDFLWREGKPLNFDASNLPRSQDMEPIYRETSGVYVFWSDVFQRTKRRIGEHPYIAEVSWTEAVDINTQDDFDFACAVLKANQREKEYHFIFDFDGVLIDSEKVQEYAFYESYKEIVGDGNCPDFSEFMKHTGDSLQNIFSKMNLPVQMAEPYSRISSRAVDQIVVNEALVNFLIQLKATYENVRFAICTGKDHKRTHEILKHFGLDQLFDAVVCSDDVREPKPSSEPTIAAMKCIGGNSENTILIGDGKNDILSARAAGIPSVLTLWYGDYHVPRIADYVSEDIDDFKKIIDGWMRKVVFK